MKRNMDYDKLEQNLKQLRFPDRVPALSFNPQEPPRAILIRNNLLALAAGIACLALVVGLALWSRHWKSELQAPPVSETPSITEPSSEAEPPFESDPTESTEESSQVEESAESSPSQEEGPIDNISSQAKPSVSTTSIPSPEPTAPTVSLSPQSVSRWRGSVQIAQENHISLIKTEEELQNWLLQHCLKDSVLYAGTFLYPVDKNTHRYHNDIVSFASVREEYQSLLNQGQVLIGVHTYYPLPVIETISPVQVQGNQLTVPIRATDSPNFNSYPNRIVTLMALPGESVKGVEQVEILSDYQSEFPLVPDPRPEPTQSYDLFEVSSRDFQGSSALQTELITSFEDFEKWVDTTFIPSGDPLCMSFSQRNGSDSSESTLSKTALLEKYRPWLEQGNALAVMDYHRNYYGFPFGFLETVREDHRLILHFYQTNRKGSGTSVELPAISDWLFVLPLEKDSVQGVTQTEFNLTTYYTPWP